MTPEPRPDQMAYQDGPNTHHYRTYTMGTTFRVVQTTDVDGVRHTFHVPLEVEQALAVARDSAGAGLREALRRIIDACGRTRNGRYLGRTIDFDATINEALGLLASPAEPGLDE